jgi:hypothetical protein
VFEVVGTPFCKISHRGISVLSVFRDTGCAKRRETEKKKGAATEDVLHILISPSE